MEQKHAYVHAWLERVFCGEGVPPYEVNSRTVDILYDMAVRCEERERQAGLLLADMEQKTREYEAETSRLRAETDWLGVAMGDLSPTATSCLKSLAEAALALNIKDCSDTSFCLALSRLARDGSIEGGVRDELVRRLAALREELKAVVLQQAAQQKMLSQLSEEVKGKQVAMDKQKRETTFLRQKAEQYSKQVSAMKEELKQAGYEPSLSHGTLLEQAAEVREVQEQLAPLKAQLTSYKDLPPDVDLARVKVEEARRKLVKLESELANKIDLVHVEK